MNITTDKIQLINRIKPVNRVVSLVPSLTETIASLGGKNLLAGVTRFCKYPEGIRNQATVVGGPIDFDTGIITGLHPDVVLAVKEENDKARVLKLTEKLPVVVFDILQLSDAFTMIDIFGKLLDREKEAAKLVTGIKTGFNALKDITHREKCIYLVWEKPWMAAGQETFINEMLRLTGFENVVRGRYPEASKKDFEQAEVLLLSSEPYPFTEKHLQELQKQYPEKKILLVDGEMFSWYGSRLLLAVDYFKGLQQTFEEL